MRAAGGIGAGSISLTSLHPLCDTRLVRTAGRAIALLLLVSWLAQGAVASATALHVELHHHGSEDEAPAASDLALRMAEIVEHGHSHELTTPEHDHPAIAAERSAVGPAPPVGLPVETSHVASGAGSEALAGTAPPERPPPRALFTLHCCLLR